MSELSEPDSLPKSASKKRKKAIEPLEIKSKSKPSSLPEFEAFSLVRVDGLWTVVTLRIKDREVMGVNSTTGDIMPIAIDKLIKRLVKSVRGKA